MLFGWSGKFYFSEIEIRWPKKKAFDHGIDFTHLFSLQSISGKWKRERETERARDCDRTGSRDQIEIAIAPDLATGSRSRSHRILRLDRDCDLAKRIEIAVNAISRRRDHTRSRSPSTLREIAPSIAISRRRWDRDRAVDRDLGSRSSDGAIWVVACVFLNLCFPSSFPNTRKYFPEIFLKYNQTQRDIFLFRKLAFPENMYFPENVLQQPNTA